MNEKKKTYLYLGGALLFVVALFLLARPSPDTVTPAESSTTPEAARAQGAALLAAANLSAPETFFDFGTVSMADGKVRHAFTLSNTGTKPFVVSRMYSSCMCTEATLDHGGRRFGPFGMPGHGAFPVLNEAIGPGESATVVAIFDPAAHGPAGVGAISRIVRLEGAEGSNVEFSFAANVTP